MTKERIPTRMGGIAMDYSVKLVRAPGLTDAEVEGRLSRAFGYLFAGWDESALPQFGVRADAACCAVAPVRVALLGASASAAQVPGGSQWVL